MTALAAFLRLREDVARTRIGSGGLDTCAALTGALDAAVIEIARGVADHPTAIVALGGYGRGEQCVWSDVDLMVLHRGGDPHPLVKGVLYPLWDANLKVGHSVRTPAECGAAARERFETLTSLLSARFVAGDPTLMADLERAMIRVVRGRPLAPSLAKEERRRRRADPYPVMAADVKDGRGGLRTLHGLWWERRRSALLGQRTVPEGDDEREAREALLRVRNALHAAAGRAVDRFLPDLREPAARWLGREPLEVATMTCRALQIGDRLADASWPDLNTETDPLARIRRRALAAVRSGSGGEDDGAASPALAVATRAATRRDGPLLSTDEQRAIGDDHRARWTGGDRAAFLRLLAGGQRGRAVFGRLEQLGWVERHLPEWKAVSAAPQLAPFHEHPVDAHLWRTVDEMRAVIADPDPVIVDAVRELGSTDALMLAAFLHDIGKGRRGVDHSSEGAAVAETVVRRMGFGPAVTRLVVAVVRHHLLLARTAVRRDIADPLVLDEIADLAGDLRTLQALYLLTMADSRATGRAMWNDWKATLLRQLYVRVAGRFAAADVGASAATLPAVVTALAGRLPERTVRDHVAAMRPDYLDLVDVADAVWHLEAVASLRDVAAVFPAGDRVVVVGADRPGFLLAVARTFAAHAIGVLDARLFTRSDGVVVDTFTVRSDRTGDVVPAEAWERVAVDLVAELAREIDQRPRIAERRRAYQGAGPEDVAVRLRPETTDRHTVIEVRAADRVGLLADIVEALYVEGLDVHFAKLDTRGGESVDVFHVRRLGATIRVESELAAVCRRIEDRVRG